MEGNCWETRLGFRNLLNLLVYFSITQTGTNIVMCVTEAESVQFRMCRLPAPEAITNHHLIED